MSANSRPIAASHYRAETRVRSTIETAWSACVNYATWNPEFESCRLEAMSGVADQVGQVVRVWAPSQDGLLLPSFDIETVALSERSFIVWCVTPIKGCAFLNFVEFALETDGDHVCLKVSCYDLVRRQPDLAEYRAETARSYQRLVAAFHDHCAL
jgi:hypothetical protein